MEKSNKWNFMPSEATQKWLNDNFEKVLRKINDTPELKESDGFFRHWLYENIEEEGKQIARYEFMEAIFHALRYIEPETWRRIARESRAYLESEGYLDQSFVRNLFCNLFDELASICG